MPQRRTDLETRLPKIHASTGEGVGSDDSTQGRASGGSHVTRMRETFFKPGSPIVRSSTCNSGDLAQPLGHSGSFAPFAAARSPVCLSQLGEARRVSTGARAPPTFRIFSLFSGETWRSRHLILGGLRHATDSAPVSQSSQKIISLLPHSLNLPRMVWPA